jgi:hypothetical protein
MAVARTDTFEQRTRIFTRLTRRNRLVGFLRLAVPAAGLVAFGLLASQIWLANMGRQYGVSGIRIDRGMLVVDTPQYAGMGTDGSRYVVNAREARSPLDNPNEISMTEATFDLQRPGRAGFHASGKSATVLTDRQLVTIPGIAMLHGDDGLRGTLTEVHSDMQSEVTTADGPVHVTFADGSVLEAANMRYEGKLQLWHFERATLVVPDLPRPAPPAIPFAVYPWVTR